MSADAAIHGIREVDSDGSIGLIGAETERPYNRPPLSKGLWKGKTIDSIWRGTDGTNAALHLGRTAGRVDPAQRQVIDDQGAEYTYDKLLLATGGTPRRFPFGGDRIVYLPDPGGLLRAPHPDRAGPALCRHRGRVYRLGKSRRRSR